MSRSTWLFASGAFQFTSFLSRPSASAPSFSSQSPTSHDCRSARSSSGSVRAAKSSARAGSLIRFVTMKLPPFSKSSMARWAAMYLPGGAAIQIAPNTATSLLGSASRILAEVAPPAAPDVRRRSERGSSKNTCRASPETWPARRGTPRTRGQRTGQTPCEFRVRSSRSCCARRQSNASWRLAGAAELQGFGGGGGGIGADAWSTT